MTTCIVLGGTFDPVHNGHLLNARLLAERMGYEHIRLMPCGDAYHKVGSSRAKHRIAMLTAALAEQSILTLDIQETQRTGATYTVDTLYNLRQQLGKNAHIVWVMGCDAAAGLQRWHNWQQIFKLANIIVFKREGEPNPDLSAWPAKVYSGAVTHDNSIDGITEFKQQPFGCLLQLTLEPIAVSSSEIRQALCNKQNVENHVPLSVIHYIEQHGLYQGKI